MRLSPDRTKFYFTSSEGSVFERHLYSMSFDGSARTRLTTMTGNNQADVSPDDRTLAVVRSYTNRPPELYLQPNRPAPDQTSQATGTPDSNPRAANARGTNGEGAEVKKVTDSPIPEFFNYNWIDPPIVGFRARDGATVYGRLYKPSNARPARPA